ncbi:MAG TPA: class I tRNA ligase family protein [Dehalococcoidia bacterium]|nr:class I tRNA ligase family protein [Dehalococcoidia bacterium]
MPFKPVPNRVDYVALEHDVQAFWDANDLMRRYLERNKDAPERWSFIDGPITANNPMGVHHAWGRSYKDLYQRYKTMRGFRQRYQNGYDCQGLWIEVEEEKELGFRSKRDIERYGVANFVEACKARVQRFAAQITQQSIRLGYWMDWDDSYFTNSDENNYTIWGFLKKCWQKGWLYKGHDTMPWCPSCGTAMSQQEIVTEGYLNVTHKSVYLKFPITSGNRSGDLQVAKGGGTSNPQASSPESLLVWTTTPWTLPANVAAAVHPELTYVRVRQDGEVYYLSKGAVATAIKGEHEVLGELPGSELVGLTYRGPFDELPAQDGIEHRVIEWDEVQDDEGTGIVHIAPGCGAEDYALSKELGLAVIAPLEEDGTYTVGGGFGALEGRFAGDVPEDVFASLAEKGVLYRVQDYTHSYPHCWRDGTELVFRLVDEWFISMDGPLEGTNAQGGPLGGVRGVPGNTNGRTLRDAIAANSDQVDWIPEFGKARERDWLRNMHDWMISKKRYYGLALPIYECKACGNFEVIGSETELKDRAVEGWDEFEGHSPHRPYVDAVKIACSNCGERVDRILDVGNPWLDAGIVPFSTLDYRSNPDHWQQWFPADWVSESFPGQFRNWFYALLAMGTVMTLDTDQEGTPPFLSLFSYALLRDEDGEEMHKSRGNAIWFEDAAEKMGADVMRWLYLRANPASNLNFGYGVGEELKRGFLSTLWNTYSFFVTYANIDGWQPGQRSGDLQVATGGGEVQRPGGEAEGFNPQSPSPTRDVASLTDLDRWALSELNQLVLTCTNALESYDSMTVCRQIEEFVEGLSNWYVRRSRRRFWKAESDADKQAAYQTLYTCLETVNRLMAPMMPFLAEDMYQNLVVDGTSNVAATFRSPGEGWGKAPQSVHLCDWPAADESLIDTGLSNAVRSVQRIVSLGRAARSKANIRVRQPLGAVHVRLQGSAEAAAVRALADQVLDELNVKQLHVIEEDSGFFEYQVLPNLPLLGPKYGREVGRIQNALREADKAALVREVSAGRNVKLDGFELQPDELLVTMSGKPGYAVAEEAGYAVAIATEITPDLADEGLARELVRRIQEMRKSAGFDISDRIRIAHDGDAEVARVLESPQWRDYVAQETLADAIVAGTDGAYSEQHDIDGRKVTLAVEKV